MWLLSMDLLKSSGIVVAAALSAAAVALTIVAAQPESPSRTYRAWPSYGGGPEQIRYSSLDNITAANVDRLQVAWTFDTGEEGGLQTNPIVIDGRLYATTPQHHVVALDAVTGALLWRFDSGVESRGPNRGVMYWTDGESSRIFAAAASFVYALDARTGVPVQGFGRDGRIDLREGLGRPADLQSVRLTSPGVVYRDLLIVGGRVSEGLPASPGDIRAYDVRTGALRWSFHTIPHPGEHGDDTWPADAWRYAGGANSWPGMALDERRGIVYVPTGSSSADFYGANRLGNNLYANCLLALDASTGKLRWYFQAVHHDLWDRDFPSPPSLVTVIHDGRRVDAVAQTTKHGYVFVFDRENGTPLFPIEEQRFPPSTVDGERTSPTQPIPLRPLPFARQRLTADMLTTRTPEAHAAAAEAFASFRSDGQFVPLSVGKDTIVFPGFDGGAEWGGSAFDPETGLLYVNANEMAWTGALAETVTGTSGRDLYLRNCATCHGDTLQGAPPQIPSLVGAASRLSVEDMTRTIRQGSGRMPGMPSLTDEAVQAIVTFVRTGRDRDPEHASPDEAALKYRFTGYKKFLDPDGYPAITPPWGTLTAIDLNTGEHAWQVPLGEYPELAAKGLTDTGSENYGGPVVTAGGVVFIGATSFDKKVRAFDKKTGRLLWSATLPFSATGTPATYEAGGRQFLVVPAGGGKDKQGEPSGGVYVAFALPAQ
jgi:quinoprotein glucose dehydrogenase